MTYLDNMTPDERAQFMSEVDDIHKTLTLQWLANNDSDSIAILEIARVGLSMVFDEIAEELDLSDDELKRLQLKIIELTEGDK